MAIVNTKQLIDAELCGRVSQYVWRKTPSIATNAGFAFDLSMSPGNPPAKYWFDAPPYVATAITRSADGGLYHGANVSPSAKYLRSITAMTGTSTALPMHMALCDYLLYYPTIDQSITEDQTMTNNTVLPRYADGRGVQVLCVLLSGNAGNGPIFQMEYTNSEGVTGRLSTIRIATSTGKMGQIGTHAINYGSMNATIFCTLQDNDSGVRSIQRVTMQTTDIGLFTLILVKPLMRTQIFETTAPYEKDCLVIGGEVPRIYDDAFLNFVCVPNGTLAATALVGDIKVIWD